MNCHGFPNTGKDLAFEDPPRDGPLVPDSLASHPDFSFTYSRDPGVAKLGGVVKPQMKCLQR